MLKRITGVLLLTALAVAACGGAEDDGTTEDTAAVAPTVADGLPTAPTDDASGTVMGPIGDTMTVAALLEAEPGGPYSVAGYLFVLEDGRIILSDVIAESYPPQPGGAQIEVSGVNLQTVPLTEPVDAELATVQWTDTPIELIGSLADGVFVGSTPASS